MEKNKFDENTKHIEDRLWAQKQIQKNEINLRTSSFSFSLSRSKYSGNINRVARISKILTQKPIERKTFKLIYDCNSKTNKN